MYYLLYVPEDENRSFEPARKFDIKYVVIQLLSRVRLCNPMDCSMPGSPVLHCLPEFAQIHVH